MLDLDSNIFELLGVIIGYCGCVLHACMSDIIQAMYITVRWLCYSHLCSGCVMMSKLLISTQTPINLL